MTPDSWPPVGSFVKARLLYEGGPLEILGQVVSHKSGHYIVCYRSQLGRLVQGPFGSDIWQQVPEDEAALAALAFG